MAQYNGNFTDENGRPVKGASVFVYTSEGVTADITDTNDSPIVQPLLTDENGNFAYRAEDGFYNHHVWVAKRLVFADNAVFIGDPNVSLAMASAEVMQSAAAVADDRIAVEVAASAVAQDRQAAQTARDQAVAAGFIHNIYPIEARDYVPRGAIGHGAITPGAGGANGVFPLAFVGGDFDTNPTGTFTVAGGAVTAINLTGTGLYIGNAAPAAPALSFAASAGLAGAAAALTVGYLVGGGGFYYAPSDDDGYVSQFQNVANAATLIEEHFDVLSVGAAIATAVREFPDYRETFGSLEFTAGAFIAAPGNAFGTNDTLVKDGYLREYTVTRQGPGTHRMFLLNASAQVTWWEVFTADAGGDSTYELVDVPMPAGSRLLYENLTGDGILWENVGAEPFFPVASWSGVIGDTVALNPANPVSVCLSYKASYTPSTAKIAEIDTAIAALGEAEGATRDDRIVDATGEISVFELTTTGFFSRNGYRQPIADTRVFAAAVGANVRYDQLYYDALAGTFGVVAGTPRVDDAPEFIPQTAGPGRLPVFNVRVTNVGISIVPVWNILNGEDRSLAGWLEQERNRSRKCIRRVRGMIARGDPLHVLAIGDSITALQSNFPALGDPPNGPLRDRAAAAGTATTYLRDKIGDDIVDNIPLYTAVQNGMADDGIGAQHTRVGVVWKLLDQLVEKAGYTLGAGSLRYSNFAIAGQVSGSVCTGDDLQTWGTNAVAEDADLVIYAFGMNELNDPATLANAIGAIKAFRAEGEDGEPGAEVIVLAPPRPRTLSVPGWIFTHACLELAAREAGAAFVPTLPLYDDRTIGAMGMTGGDVCVANGINHPGLLEFDILGDPLCALVLD